MNNIADFSSKMETHEGMKPLFLAYFEDLFYAVLIILVKNHRNAENLEFFQETICQKKIAIFFLNHATMEKIARALKIMDLNMKFGVFIFILSFGLLEKKKKDLWRPSSIVEASKHQISSPSIFF